MSFLTRIFGGAPDPEPASGSTPAAQTPDAAGAAPPAGAPPAGDPKWESIQAQIVEAPRMNYISEAVAAGEIAAIYADIKATAQYPEVPLFDQALAHSPHALRGVWDMTKALISNTSLPMPVVVMVFYGVASALNCKYCSSAHRLACQTLGVDEETMRAIGSDLAAVAPERINAILTVAIKAGSDPMSVTAGDLQRLRDMGTSEAEIVDVVAIAGLARLTNTIVDTFRIDVDPFVKQAFAA